MVETRSCRKENVVLTSQRKFTSDAVGPSSRHQKTPDVQGTFLLARLSLSLFLLLCWTLYIQLLAHHSIVFIRVHCTYRSVLVQLTENIFNCR